jgi:hypothetical protein
LKKEEKQLKGNPGKREKLTPGILEEKLLLIGVDL